MTPELFILAGPNGAGKTTCATRLIPKDVPFVNADEIAKSLAGFEGVVLDMRASRLLLKLITAFEKDRRSFAMETNLANRGLLPRIRRLQENGYHVTLIFLWLPSVDLAIDRVMERVRRGGHSVPASVIRRRYQVGLRNFLNTYRDAVDSWLFIDNSDVGNPVLIANKTEDGKEKVLDSARWNKISNGRKHNGR